MKINTTTLADELRENARQLGSVIDSFSDSSINIIPFEGSWTAGQVCDHLLKSGSGMPEVLLENTSQVNRPADQHVEMIRKMFLDFSSKMQSPEFIIPSSGPFDKKMLADALENNLEEIIRIAETEDLSPVCESFAFPGVGNLTRFEWINFLSCHTKRHTHQLENILASI